jgi:hypothetical protein
MLRPAETKYPPCKDNKYWHPRNTGIEDKTVGESVGATLIAPANPANTLQHIGNKKNSPSTDFMGLLPAATLYLNHLPSKVL